MEKTIEIISGKLSNVEDGLKNLATSYIATIKNYDSNFDTISKWHKSDRKFHKFVVVAGICGAYAMYKQNKEIKALKAKIEEQGKEEDK